MTDTKINKNYEHVKSIADGLDEIANGYIYKCPECGEWVEVSDIKSDTEHGLEICPECGEVMTYDDFELVTMWDYFDEVYNIKYVMDSDKELESVKLMVACGGPNIWVDTDSGTVELYWWGDRATAYLSTDAIEQINELGKELFYC